MGRLRERYSRVARYYQMDYDPAVKKFSYRVEETQRAAAEKLDGSYLLKTDRDAVSAEEAWRIYILLTRAEAAFRMLKSPLEERPIFTARKCAWTRTSFFACWPIICWSRSRRLYSIEAYTPPGPRFAKPSRPIRCVRSYCQPTAD